MPEPILTAAGLAAIFAGEGVKAAAKAVTVPGFATRWYRYATARKVVVTGVAGVGKTVLLDRLTTGKGLHYEPPRTSQLLEKGWLVGGRCTIRLLAVPGQDNQPQHDAHRKLSRAGYHGLVHGVSFGYSSLRDEASERQLIASGHDTLEKYRALRLKEELEELRATLRSVRDAVMQKSQPCWMIVAPTKIDLYAHRVQEAADYYSPSGTSAFADEMRRFVAQVGSDRMRWTALPVCALLHKFSYNGQVEVSKLDDTERAKSLSIFAATLEDYALGS